jgi:hypothetical protein
VATKSISSGAQYVTLGKYFSHPSLVLYCFATPRIKLKLGQQIGGGPITGNHLDKSLWWTDQKHWAAVRSYLSQSILRVHNVTVPFTSLRNMGNYGEPKPLSWAKPNPQTWIFFILFNFARSHTKHSWRCSK